MAGPTLLADPRPGRRPSIVLLATLVVAFTGAMAPKASATIEIQNYNDPAGDPTRITYRMFAGEPEPLGDRHVIIPASALAAQRRRSCSIGSPASAWTPEDESAASLLLQMSSSPVSAGSGSAASATARMAALALPKALEFDAPRAPGAQSRGSASPAVQAQTPSSLFGLAKRR